MSLHDLGQEVYAYTLGIFGGISGWFGFDWVHSLAQINFGHEIIYETFKAMFGILMAIVYAILGKIAQLEYEKYLKRKKQKKSKQ